MNQTDHHLLVGKGAQTFARNMGFTIEDDLNTPLSRKLWLEWKQRTDPKHYLTPKEREIASAEARRQMAAEGLFPASQDVRDDQLRRRQREGRDLRRDDDLGSLLQDPGPRRRLADPGRRVSTWTARSARPARPGRGEANLYNLSSFFIVESMRRGMHPKDAGMEALKRIKANTVEKRLLNARGNPNFNVNFYALNAKGEFAGVAMYALEDDEKGWAGETGRRVRYAVCDAKGPRTLQVEGLLPGTPNGAA